MRRTLMQARHRAALALSVAFLFITDTISPFRMMLSSLADAAPMLARMIFSPKLSLSISIARHSSREKNGIQGW
jgi:hypothetical protein